ncbi:MAG: LacI family DNA-binding transcriptional regulator, partial [Oliverpabstia sp.]
MGNKKNITFNDIAEYTHFSKTTISRYFNNPDSLTLENQQIIADALEKLNYKENKVARILANGKTEFIGVIVPDLYHHYYSEMLNQILSTYETFGYKFLVFIGNEHEETERRYIQELMAYKIEGLIIMSHTIPSKELSELQIPVVTIEREDQYVSSVNTDNYMGGYQATSLLARHNCDVLIHINSPTSESVPAYGRIKGFYDLCAEKQIPHQVFIRQMGHNFESTYQVLVSIVEELEQKYHDMKKGIFISNDTHANVLLNILFRKYGSLPDDYLLIGFDNSPVSREAILPISTIGQQIDQIAYEAVSILVEQMNERKKRRPVISDQPIHKVITPVLIRRETTEK